jgi:hypothetical protein
MPASTMVESPVYDGQWMREVGSRVARTADWGGCAPRGRNPHQPWATLGGPGRPHSVRLEPCCGFGPAGQPMADLARKW